jgi:hypothetical protein
MQRPWYLRKEGKGENVVKAQIFNTPAFVLYRGSHNLSGKKVDQN